MYAGHEVGVQIQLQEIADRHGVSLDAVEHLFSALKLGGGSQAQFNHPELGGLGQWSSGGMLMIGDMFNHDRKATVASLCSELAKIVANSDLTPSSFVHRQSQHQGSGGQTNFSKMVSSNWWPEELGQAASTGAQNNMRYAIFPSSRRLALSMGDRVTIYDTKDHLIGGVSQQQSGDQNITLTSQHGQIDISKLKEVDAQITEPVQFDDRARDEAPAELDAPPPVKPSPSQSRSDDDVFDKIERLSSLRSKGILSDEEFSEKKSELLSRL